MRLSLPASALLLAACGSESTAPVPTGNVDARVRNVEISESRVGDISVLIENRGGPGRVQALAWIRPAPLSSNAGPRESCRTAETVIRAGDTTRVRMTGCGLGNGGGPIGWIWVISINDTIQRTSHCFAVPGAPMCPVFLNPANQ